MDKPVMIQSYTYRDSDHSFVGKLFTGEYFWCNANICDGVPFELPANVQFAAAEKIINNRLKQIAGVRDQMKNEHGVIIVWG